MPPETLFQYAERDYIELCSGESLEKRLAPSRLQGILFPRNFVGWANNEHANDRSKIDTVWVRSEFSAARSARHARQKRPGAGLTMEDGITYAGTGLTLFEFVAFCRLSAAPTRFLRNRYPRSILQIAISNRASYNTPIFSAFTHSDKFLIPPHPLHLLYPPLNFNVHRKK